MSEEVPTMPQTTHSGARCDSGLQGLSTMWSWNTCSFSFKLIPKNWHDRCICPGTSFPHAWFFLFEVLSTCSPSLWSHVFSICYVQPNPLLPQIQEETPLKAHHVFPCKTRSILTVLVDNLLPKEEMHEDAQIGKSFTRSPQQRWPIWEAIVATARHSTWSLATVQSLRLQDKGWHLASDEPKCDMIACYEENQCVLSCPFHLKQKALFWFYCFDFTVFLGGTWTFSHKFRRFSASPCQCAMSALATGRPGPNQWVSPATFFSVEVEKTRIVFVQATHGVEFTWIHNVYK